MLRVVRPMGGGGDEPVENLLVYRETNRPAANGKQTQCGSARPLAGPEEDHLAVSSFR
jgi:hypothetical protein